MQPAQVQIEEKAAITFARSDESDPNTNYIFGLAMTGPFWSWSILVRPGNSRGPTRYEDPSYLSPSTPSSDTSGSDVDENLPSSRPPSRAASLSARSQISAALSEGDTGTDSSRGSESIPADVSHERPSDEEEESPHANPESVGCSRATSSMSSEMARGLSSPIAELRPELEASPSQSRPQKRRRLWSPSPDDEGDDNSDPSEDGSRSENENKNFSEEGDRIASEAPTNYERPENLPRVEDIYPEVIGTWSRVLPPWTDPAGMVHLLQLWNALFLCFPAMWVHYNQNRSA
ncbi:hypothetical protein C8Q70DRAFT_464444 [Cubamyces menziesii]|nr:hypothetical protein C8Q70DRAFT_464444 [Cubamyces menziesii]